LFDYITSSKKSYQYAYGYYFCQSFFQQSI